MSDRSDAWWWIDAIDVKGTYDVESENITGNEI